MSLLHQSAMSCQASHLNKISKEKFKTLLADLSQRHLSPSLENCFYFSNPHDKNRELTTVNCPMTSTPSLWHTGTHTYTMASIATGKTGTWQEGHSMQDSGFTSGMKSWFFFHFLCCLYSIWQARLEQKAFRSLCCSCGLSCIRGRSSLDITSSCSVPRVAVSWSGFVLEKGIAELLDKRTQYIILKGTKFLNGEHFQSLGMCCFSLSKYWAAPGKNILPRANNPADFLMDISLGYCNKIQVQAACFKE